MAPLLLIGTGGFLGAIARYLLDARITAWTGGSLPWGTFAVNVTGSFAVGVLFALIVERAEARRHHLSGRPAGRHRVGWVT